VEYGRAVLVAATSGVSAVIAPDGMILDQSAVFTPDLLTGAVPVRGGLTLAARLGAVPEWMLSLAGLVAAGIVVVGSVFGKASTAPRRTRAADRREETETV
jgi:apolipoprotein N-acyltransferase